MHAREAERKPTGSPWPMQRGQLAAIPSERRHMIDVKASAKPMRAPKAMLARPTGLIGLGAAGALMFMHSFEAIGAGSGL